MSLSSSIFGQATDSRSKSDVKSHSCNELLVSLFESSSKLPSKRNLIPSPPATTTVRKKKVQEDDGVEGLSPESVRKRKTSFGREGFDQKGSQTLANGATSKRKKPKKISSEIDDMATNDNEREKNDHESGNTSMAAAENDGGETCDEVESRTIFVGNLPLSMTRKKLTCIFSKCGTVESTRIRSVPVKGVKLPPESAGNQKLMRKVCVNKGLIDDTLKKTLQGYVVFADVSSVKAALELNNAIIPMEPKDGTDTSNTQLRMRVDTAKPTIDTARSVFVGNLPYSAQEGLLQEHFLTQLGDDSVEGVRIVRDRETMQCKGFGYVLLKTKALVAEALTKLPESIFMKRKLRVKACGKRFKGTAKRLAPIEGSTKDTINQTFEGRRATPITGASRRILHKMQHEGAATPQNGKKRRRTEKKNTPTKHTISKRAAANVKANKKVKKLQKRLSKGMGKTKH